MANYTATADKFLCSKLSHFLIENGTKSTNSNTDLRTSMLDCYNLAYAESVFPVIVFLFTVMGIGGVGNIMVCIVYLCNKRKSVNGRFILTLAFLDLINCLLCIPSEIADLRYKATFGEFKYLCKSSRALLAFSSTSSCGVLVAIAIDRYKNICKPFSRQTTIAMARTAILTCCLLSTCFSVPAWFVNGKRRLNVTDTIEGSDCSISHGKRRLNVTDTIEGSDCSISQDYIQSVFPKIYNASLLFLFLTGCFILIVLYTLMWKRVKIQSRFRNAIVRGLSILKYSKRTRKRLGKDNGVKQKATTDRSYSTLTLDSISSPQLQRPLLFTSALSTPASSPSQSMELLPHTKQQSKEKETKPRKVKTTGKSRTSPRVSKTTFVMFLVTVLFITSFLPYLVITSMRSLDKTAFHNIDGMNFILYNLFLRFHFLNSAFNPIVYSFCGQQFRKDVLLIFKKPCC